MVRRAGKYSVAAADLLHRAPHAPLNIRLSITSFLCWISLEKRYITLSEDHQVSRILVAVQTSFKTSAFSDNDNDFDNGSLNWLESTSPKQQYYVDCFRKMKRLCKACQDLLWMAGALLGVAVTVAVNCHRKCQFCFCLFPQPPLKLFGFVPGHCC